MYEDCREKGKTLFKLKKYKDALKLYEKSVNILSGLSKKIFSNE